MPKAQWRGLCYVYNFQTKEFLRCVSAQGSRRRPNNPESLYCQWTPATHHAKAYKNPTAARIAAMRINAELYHRQSAKFPCGPVDVVSGEAARCLEIINRRSAR